MKTKNSFSSERQTSLISLGSGCFWGVNVGHMVHTKCRYVEAGMLLLVYKESVNYQHVMGVVIDLPRWGKWTWDDEIDYISILGQGLINNLIARDIDDNYPREFGMSMNDCYTMSICDSGLV